MKKYGEQVADFKHRLERLELSIGEYRINEAEKFIKSGEYDKAEAKLKEARSILETNEKAHKPRSGSIGIGTGLAGSIAGFLWFVSSGDPGALAPRTVELDSLWGKILKLEEKIKELQSGKESDIKN